VIVVDGQSTDRTTHIVNEFENAQLIINNSSHTPGSSRNRGAEAANGEIIFFCDSDCLADKHALEYHVHTYKKNSDIVGVMGSIRNANPGNPIAEFVQREIMASQWQRSLNKDGTVNDIQAGIYNLSLYRSEFLKWKFREEPYLSEDTELSLRIAGKAKILFEPRAIVYHHHRTRLQALFEQRKWYGARFFGLSTYCGRISYKPDSFYFSALRFIDSPEEDLTKAVCQDNRLLCQGCLIQHCQINTKQLPKRVESDEDLCRVICLAFASGILQQRTGIKYQWYKTD
jgi:glycosyltransferase involved in cell wall biosynthesis